jgi:hypothetical protein
MVVSIRDCLELRLLVDVLYDVQDVRMRTENRLRQMPKETSKVYSKPLRDTEDRLTLEIEGQLAKHPIYTDWLYDVKGVGPRISGSIIAQTMIRFVRVEASDYEAMTKSQTNYDAQNAVASQSLCDTQEFIASHKSDDIRKPFASQSVVDNQMLYASHYPSDAQARDASQPLVDTQEVRAFSSEQLDLAQKTEDGDYLVPTIRGIGAFDTVSKYWAWWGLDVRDGHAPKRKKGENIDWNPKMRMLAWKISKQFVMQGERYRMIYDAEKLRLTAERIGENGELFCPHLEECQAKLKKRAKPACKGHIDAMAKRKAVKMFLSHLWEKWRELEGLPVRQPYVIEKLGHTTKQEPEYA